MNRQQYQQYRMNPSNDYSQGGPSYYNINNQYDYGHFPHNYQQQSYNYGNNFHHNNMQQQQRNVKTQNYNHQNNYHQNFPHLQQNNNFTQNHHQQQQPIQNQNYQQKWGNNRNKNKRTHEYVEPTSSTFTQPSQTASPEPKRLLQRQNSFQNMPQQKWHKNQNAYQTQSQSANTILPKTGRQQNPQNKKKGGNGNNMLEAFHEQKQKEWNEMFTKTLNLLSGCRAGEEVQILITNLQPSRSLWVKTKEQIFNDLSKVMTPMGVDKILVFGSTLTGLDFYGSDLDFFIQLKKMPSNEEEIKDAIRKAAKLTRYLQGNDFYIMCTIPNARVPLIRLLHKHTRITCDVNFNSQFGYYNSYFIGHILGYDKRIKDLAVIIKLWSKSYKIASQMILSNYCLTMLIIFYLQNIENPILDTIYNNQRSRSPMVLDLNYKWNFYFNDAINNACHNHLSLRELLVGFFSFYEKLNYKDYVISLYTGTLIKRTEFDTSPELEEYRNLIRNQNLLPMKVDNNDSWTVQDGFELNLNIGTKVKKHSDALVEYFKLSHEKCIELKDKPFSELLIKLFTEIKASIKESIEGKNKNKKKYQMKIHPIAGDLKICQDILTSKHENKDKIYTVDDQRKYFFEHVAEYTSKFLNEIYLCTIVPEILEHQDNNMLTRFRVVLQFDSINGRKKMNFKDDESIEAERVLSQKMIEKKVPLDLDILLVITSVDKGKTVDIDMFDNSSNRKSPLLAFGNYFSINIALALKYYLKKRWDEIMKN